VAVDWALSKERWEAERRRVEEAGSGSNAGSDDEDSDDDEAGSDADDDSQLGLHDGSSADEGEDGDEDDDDDDDARSDADAAMRPALPAPEEGTTLFVRNVPFEAVEDEFRALCVVFFFRIGRALRHAPSSSAIVSRFA
jgi:nucleolar protein 4